MKDTILYILGTYIFLGQMLSKFTVKKCGTIRHKKGHNLKLKEVESKKLVESAN
jgi:hypothetical protein